MKKTRQFFSILLTLAMLLTLVPAMGVTALAATYPNSVELYNRNGTITSLSDGQCLVTNDGSATSYTGGSSYVARYDQSSGKLYLKGYEGVATERGIFALGDLNIVVESNSSFATSTETTNPLYGIQASGGKLDISGSGTLTVTATGNGDVYGIYATDGVTISAPLDVTVEIKDTSKKRPVYGIYTKSGAISLSDGEKTVTATGGTGGVAYGVYNEAKTSSSAAGSSITISGKLTVKLNNGESTNFGIYTGSGSTITLDAATLSIPSGFDFGIYNNNGNVDIKNSPDVKLHSEKSGSYGIWAKYGGDLTIDSSTVKVSAMAYAACLDNGKLSIKDSIVDLTRDYNHYRVVNTANDAANTIDLSGSGTVTLTALGEQTSAMIGGTVTATSGTKLKKGTHYPGLGTYDGEYDTASDKTVLQFVHESAAPTAVVEDVSIDGTTGTAIADKEVIITLANDTFASTLSGDWITNLPAGLSQSVSRTDDTHAKITVSGNPSAVSSDALIIKIPAVSLASGSDLDVTGNANAKYNIKASVAALGGSAGITGTAKYNEILTADTSAITGNTGTFLYQWKRNGTDIPGAKNSTYKIVTEDIGKTITVAISSNVESGTIVSPATATVGKADTPSAPTGLSGMKGKTLATVPLTGGWAWVDDTTVMNTAGMQTFKANYTDTTGNYENATNVDVTVNVTAKATAALTGLTQSGCTYGETLSAPSYTKPAGTIDSTIKVTYMGKGGTTYAESATKPVKAGTYTVKVTLETADTIYSGTADFTIAQKDVTIRGFKVPNSAYNGDTKTSFDKTAAEIVGKITGDDVTIDTTAAEANFAQKDVGNDIPVSFTGVKLAGADKDNYRISSVEPAKANIYQRTLTVKPDSGLSKKYGEADPALSSTVSGTIYGEMYIIDGKLEREAGENVGNYKILLGTLALKDNGAFKASNYILSLDTTAVYFEIKKAPAPSAPTGLSGMKGKTLATVPLTGGWAWADDTTVMNTAGTQTFKANYTDTTGNYENATNVDVTVEVIDKTNVSASITFADGELTYNGAGQAYETASISGITAGANPGWTYAYAPSGTGSLDASGKPQNAGTYTVTATYEDDDNYGTKSAVLKIKKAVPTGTPKYTAITTAGKTLADAAITTTGADFSVPGAVIWVADDGVTPLPDTTTVAANTYYKWLFTPTDTDNYETLTGTIRLYRRSSGGGGGGRSTSRYTVSFESNGGSKVSNQTVTRNSVMKEPTAPTKENFDFDGWYSDKELKTKYDFSAKVTKSFTLYAKWTEKDNSVNQIILTIGKKDAQVFGKAKSNDVAPKIEKDRTMLPARFVAENLGAKVEWDGEKQLVTITGKNLKTDENVTILITIGSATVMVNGKEIKLDSPAFIENDRTYTPIRFISEELGASVEWVEKDKKVIITKPEIKKAETK